MKRLLLILILPLLISSCGLLKKTTETKSQKNTVVNTTFDKEILKDKVTEITIPAELIRDIIGVRGQINNTEGADTNNTLRQRSDKPRQRHSDPVTITITDKSKVVEQTEKDSATVEKTEKKETVEKDTRAFWQRPILMWIGIGLFVVIVGGAGLKYFTPAWLKK